MSSRRTENYRRTTQRLLEQERQFAAAKNCLAVVATSRKVETAAWLLAMAATELDGVNERDASNATKLAKFASDFSEVILQRAVAGAHAGELAPRAMATPPAATAPSAEPPGFISHATLHAARLTPPGAAPRTADAEADDLGTRVTRPSK